MNIIFVTEKEFDKAEECFSSCTKWKILPASPDENALAEAVSRFATRCVIVGVEKYTGPLYEALHEVSATDTNFLPYRSLIARFGVGHDAIDKTLARQFGIAVTNTPGVLSRNVAEYTFWLIGALLRNVSKGDKAMREKTFPSWNGQELYGKKLLILGVGEIGCQVARIAHFGFGMKVLAAGSCSLDELAERRNLSAERFLSENGIARYESNVDLLLPEADILSLHLASTPRTRHFISKERLALLKPSAVLVNTARGPVVDESALFNVLSSRKIAGAALDVFETEPYFPVDESSDLRTLDNVVLTPHLGSSSIEANHRMAEAALKNVELFFGGKFDEMNLVTE